MNNFLEVLKTTLKLLLRRSVISSYSQFGEDAVLQHLLKKSTGTFVDIGAYHPVLYSNTYAFYRRGWSGIVIDPNPRFKKLYRLFRPRM